MIDSQYVKKENPKVEFGFPKLMRLRGNHGIVALFYEPGKGIVLLSNQYGHLVGQQPIGNRLLTTTGQTEEELMNKMWEDVPLGESIVLTNATEF